MFDNTIYFHNHIYSLLYVFLMNEKGRGKHFVIINKSVTSFLN